MAKDGGGGGRQGATRSAGSGQSGTERSQLASAPPVPVNAEAAREALRASQGSNRSQREKA